MNSEAQQSHAYLQFLGIHRHWTPPLPGQLPITKTQVTWAERADSQFKSLCFFYPCQSLVPYSLATGAAFPFTWTPMDTVTPPLSGTPQHAAPVPEASTPKLLWDSSRTSCSFDPRFDASQQSPMPLRHRLGSCFFCLFTCLVLLVLVSGRGLLYSLRTALELPV